MLLLAHLIARSDEWQGAKVRVIGMNVGGRERITLDGLKQLLSEVRIQAEPEVFEAPKAEELREVSARSSVVFIPFKFWKNELVGPFGEHVEDLFRDLPVVALVMVAEDMDLDAEPEDGAYSLVASALDAHAQALKRAKKLEKDADEAARSLDKAEARLRQMKAQARPGEVDRETMATIESAAEDEDTAREKMVSVLRRAAKARARVEQAAEALRDLGVALDDHRAEDLDRSSEPDHKKDGTGTKT
jgi:hypothetical protein